MPTSPVQPRPDTRAIDRLVADRHAPDDYSLARQTRNRGVVQEFGSGV
jgi:hypothetical protein